MKRWLALLIAAAVVVGVMLVVYNQNNQPEPEEPEEPVAGPEPEPEPAYPTVNLADHDALARDYLEPFYSGGVFSHTWEQAEDIEPDSLVAAFVFGHYDDDWTEDDWTLPRDWVESYIKDYIPVSSDRLRTSDYYDEAAGAYVMDGIGAPLEMRVTYATQEEAQLIIHFDALSRNGSGSAVYSSIVEIELHRSGHTYKRCTLVEGNAGDLTYTGADDAPLPMMSFEWLLLLAAGICIPVYLVRLAVKEL